MTRRRERKAAPSAVLAVMAKKPVPGAVKTRLARAIGAAAASDLYRAFLRDLQARLAAGPWRLIWAVDPADSDLSADVGTRLDCIGQRGVELGEKMWNVFGDLLEESGQRTKVVMIGADLPHLEPPQIEAAFSGLESADVVLMPTRDGGYGLVGLRRREDLFRGIPMSSVDTLRATLARAEARGLRVKLLPQTFDVDEESDLEELRCRIDRGEIELPFTAAFLAAHPKERL